MSTARPVVSVYNQESNKADGTVAMPPVFTSPLRPDLVRQVHRDLNKNRRQPHGVFQRAGYGTAAESWGTGRAVARIPRVPGGGTHRASQAAFGNMCAGGGMFEPLKTWRRWHRKVNLTQKRHAVASALAASALPPLVMARGHRIAEVAELPLVIDDSVQQIQKTRVAVALLERLGLKEELQKVSDSKKLRCGQGKNRNRKYTMRRGPLVVYEQDDGLTKAVRNIPGVDTACVTRLSLLQLAPGGHFGRMVIFTKSAFAKLGELFGSYTSPATLKKGYTMMRPAMTNCDLARLINSDEIQAVVRPAKLGPKKTGCKKNPLKNRSVMARLNPGAVHRSQMRAEAHKEGTKARALVVKQKRDVATEQKKHRAGSKKFFSDMQAAFAAEK